MKNILRSFCLLALAFCLLLTGCVTRRTDPATGVVTKTFDPVKTEQVKAAITPVTASIVRRVIRNSPQHAAEISGYLRAVGGVFCAASASGQLGPEQILAALDRATLDLQAGVDGEIIDGKNLLLALYRINYGDRFQAELPADKWPRHVADLICSSIDQGLKDAGQPGVK